ncbi:histidine phosphatase family protein [Roseibium sp. SCPC15]|jgi:phosphohistidine phosphatase|uniref:SixA phosphatase family protein n=1 Tax=Roseibium sp. SCP15 TaxID=3141376 RepID=UPI0033361FFE
MRLLLLRHAKSDWGDPSLADIDRPLNRRGKSAAGEIARYMKSERLVPNRILCSTSQRTRETLAKVLPYLQQEAQILLLSDLYLQSEDDYTGLIRKHGGRAQNLMIIGHNPATEETALSLAGTGKTEAMDDLRIKYPTAALAVIDFDINDWSELKAKTGHLERFVKPRDL